MTTFLPNRLNEYETYTYNIKMYIMDPRDFPRRDRAIKTGRAILIADNASVAKYNITNCEQIFTVGHGQVREALGNRFDLTIVEPNGVTLLSTIKTAARQLQINNHINAGYLIQIEFNGRKRNGVPHKFSQVFYYTGMITDFTFKVDEGGATYNIYLVESSADAYRYLTNRITGQITVEAQTVGEFFDKFETLLNESMLDEWVANPTASQYPMEFKFEFDQSTEDWRNWRFQVLDTPFETQGVEFIGLPGDNPSLQVIITNGSQITSVFNSVLQLTAEYKRILTDQKENSAKFARSSPERIVDNMEMDTFPVFMKVLSNIEYGPFDILTGDYSKRVVFKLKKYVVTDMVLDAELYKRGITNARVQSARINNMIERNYLRKRYDYIYTGRNTEILNFDMDFNFSYFQMLAQGEGWFGDARVQTPQLLNDRPEVQARLANIVDAVVRTRNATTQRNNIRNANVSDASAVGGFSEVDQILARERETLNNAIDANIKILQEEYGLTPDEISWNLRFAVDAVSAQDYAGSDNDERSATLKMGAVKFNLESSADFHTIEMEIRGDPYWMGKPNSFQQTARDNDELVDYETGSANFFLNVSFPTSGEDNAGRRKPSPDYQLSGVFKVINVINRFNNGQFVQYLKAVRDMGTNIPTVWEQLNNERNVSGALNNARQRQLAIDAAQTQEDAGLGIGPQ